MISPAGTLGPSPFPGLLRLIWLTISLPWSCATYDNVRQGALYRSQKRSTEGFLSGKSIFVGMPSSGQQACHRPLYGSGSAYQAENHHSLSATVFANLRLTTATLACEFGWRRPPPRTSSPWSSRDSERVQAGTCACRHCRQGRQT